MGDRAAVTIYMRGGKILLRAQDRLVSGIWLDSDAVEALSVDDVDGVGPRLKAMFAASKQGLPHPAKMKPMSERMAPLFEAAGVKSYKQLVAGAKCVAAYLESGIVTLTPTRNEGGRSGFAYLDRSRSVPVHDPALGHTVLAALADSE